MKIKNRQVEKILNALYAIGNRQPVKERFEITKIAHKFKDSQEMIEKQIDQIIQSRYEKDKVTTSIQRGDSEYIELMNCETDIDFKGFTIDELVIYNPTSQELEALFPLIKEV